MRARRRQTVFLLLAAALVAAAAAPCAAQGVPAVAETAGADTTAVLAILPFANNTARGDADSLYTVLLHRLLAERGVAFIPSAELRPALRSRRIRSRGWIGREGMELLVAETGARYLLLGSWDVYRDSGNPEVGFSLRVLDTEAEALVAAVSLGGTGEDTVGWLDLGRIESMEELATAVMGRALDMLVPLPPPPEVRPSWRGCNHLAVIPFDNFSETPYAGDIMTNVVLSQLLAAGYFVLEPGFVRELELARETVVKGGVDRASARAIRTALGACRVITGAVETFEPARGLPSVSVPRIAVGIRVTYVESGNLYAMREIEGAGDDGQSVFQKGRIHGLIPLANRLIRDYAVELSKDNREDIIHGPRRQLR
jgi:hypothetical protein